MEIIKAYVKEQSDETLLCQFELIKFYYKDYKTMIHFYLSNKKDIEHYDDKTMANLVKLFIDVDVDYVKMIYEKSKKFCEKMKNEYKVDCEYIDLFICHYIQILDYYLENKKNLWGIPDRSDISCIGGIIKRGEYIMTDEEKYIINMRLNKEVFTDLGAYTDHGNTYIKWFDYNDKKYIEVYSTGWMHNTIICEYKEGKFDIMLHQSHTMTGMGCYYDNIYGYYTYDNNDDKSKLLEDIYFMNDKFEAKIWKEVIEKIKITDNYKNIVIRHKVYFAVKEKLCMDFAEYCHFLNSNIYS